MNERVMNLLAELEGKVAELKKAIGEHNRFPKVLTAYEAAGTVVNIPPIGTADKWVAALEANKEELKTLIREKEPEKLSDADLRTIAFNNFLKTGDVTHIAPDGHLAKKTLERELFAPYLFCTITKIVGRTVYFVRASDSAQMTRSAVMVPELEGKITEGPCVVYHQKVISQWAPAEKKQWQERGYAFNALFRS